MDASALRDGHQPHWWWAIASIVVPLGLMLIALLGLGRGAPVPLSLAATAPGIALVLSFGAFAAAVVRARRVPILITAVGLVVSGAGFLLLLWVGE
jgi:hypothetical protein